MNKKIEGFDNYFIDKQGNIYSLYYNRFLNTLKLGQAAGFYASE